MNLLKMNYYLKKIKIWIIILFSNNKILWVIHRCQYNKHNGNNKYNSKQKLWLYITTIIAIVISIKIEKKKKNVKIIAPVNGRTSRSRNYNRNPKNIPFFLFLAFLAVLYIYNGHLADKLTRKIGVTEKHIKELQYEYKTVKSEVIFRSKASELVRAVEPLGLRELTEAPVVLTPSAPN